MILVTGAAGFIGSNLVAALNEQGRNDLILCDWLGTDERWRNLSKHMFYDFVSPDVLHAELDRLKPEAIFHIGANSSTTASDGDEIMRNNLQFTLRLIEWCTAARVPIVYASSAATYGDGDNGFEDRFSYAELRKLRPLNLYGWSKHHVDLILADRVEKGLPVPPRCIGLKYFNVYGPNEHHKGSMMSVVGKLYRTVREGGRVQLFKSHREDFVDGGQRRDFVHVDDIVAITLWFMSNGPRHGVFNAGTGQATSFVDFVGALFAACGQEPAIDYIPMPQAIREKYQYFTEASTDNLRQAGYRQPFLDVREGVARYVRILEQSDPYR